MLEIVNLVNKMEVSNKLLLIIGRFSPDSGSSTQVTIKNKQYPQLACDWPIWQNELKAMCYLNVGENDLKIIDNHENVLRDIKIYLICRQKSFFIKPIYIVCEGEDGCFQGPFDEDTSVDSACNRIKLAADMLQTFYAHSLNIFPKDGLCFSLPSSGGKTQCEIFRSKLKASEVQSMNSRDLWVHFARELTSSGYPVATKFLAFLACTRYTVSKNQVTPTFYKDMFRYTSGYAASGNGGLALIGTPCLFTWPVNLQEVVGRLTNQTKVDRSLFFDDSANR